MQALLAKKIVLRVQSGLATHLSYPRLQVEDAFRVMGATLTAEHLKPWTDQEAKVQEDPAALAARQEANRVRREQTAANLEARRIERTERRKAGVLRSIRLASMRTGVIADHVQGAPVSAADVAVAAGRAAFEQTMQKGSVPTSIEITPVSMGASVEVPESGLALADLTVDELKEMAKAKGLKGISTKKKADLIAMLTEA